MKKLFLSAFFLLFAALALVPAQADAQGLVPCGGDGQPACTFCHTFSLLKNILDIFLFPTVPVIAALLIAVGGFFLFTGAASPQNLNRGRTIIFAVVIGLLIIYGSWLFINLLLDSLGVTIWTGPGTWFEIDCPIPLSMSLDGPASVVEGSNATLVWTIFGGPATTCTATGDWGGAKSTTSDSETLSSLTPVGTKTYTLECEDPDGNTVSDSITMAVTACPGPDGTCLQRPIAVDNPGPARTNYQVKFTLDTAALVSAGKMKANCEDLRVTDTDGTTIISHWIENGCNSPTTNIWTKAPSLAGGAVTTLRAHYGNPTLSSTSDFAGTFPSRRIVSGVETSLGPQSFDWFEVESGAIFNITDGTAQEITARKIVVAGSVLGIGRGFDGAPAVGIGLGPRGGSHKSGGAYGGAGGQGGTGKLFFGLPGVPGSPYGRSDTQAIQMGSGGGAADSSQTPGGDGGGAVTFKAQEIEISGTVAMNGDTRGTGTNSNGGGGGGGILILSSRVNLPAPAALFAAGGNGEAGLNRAGGAGGGGGGRIKIFSDESISDASAKAIAGGPGSLGGTIGAPFDPGADGAPGTTHTGTFTSNEPTTTVGPES